MRPQCTNCTNHSVYCDYSTSLETPKRPATAIRLESPPKPDRLITWIFVPSDYQNTSKLPSADSVVSSGTSTSTGTQSSPSVPSTLPSPSPAPTATQSLQTPTTFDFHDFTLHHHYLTSTCYTLAEDEGSLHFWRDEAPQLANAHPFILHLILALAGLHKTRVNSDHIFPDPERNGSWLVNRAEHHSAIGLSELSSLVAHISPDNIQAVWAGATILCFLPMARGPRPGDYLFFSVGPDVGTMAEWPALVRGVRTLSGMSGDMKPRREKDTSYQVVLGSMALGMDCRGPLEALRERVFLGSEKQQDSSNGRDVRSCYVNAIDLLERMFDEICGGRGEYGIGRLAMIIYDWICCFEDGLDAFQKKEPVTMILLAYFLVLLKLHDGVWFARGWPEHIMEGIKGCLDEDDRRWIQWPMERIPNINTLKIITAGTIIAPSSPINNFSFRIVELVQPCSNSIRTEKTIAENNTITAGMCALPRREDTSRQKTRQAKSAPRATKTVMDTSWKMMPPTMMCVPVDWEEDELVALVLKVLELELELELDPLLPPPPAPDDAMPPPAAWTTNETMSQVQKIQSVPKHPIEKTEHHQARNHTI
ncbi:hypothetical protein ASPBRDRAFT_73571 [Aspergillus brasiliensis CBS 101740]|uniref:Zn(2)-C6 fungal-type domain-containing protein n=1 Tax=Aspergillus brasiliensis (strain CBS 101740 / IMI 381727 / IBT 21946) TaxID=767769 RepID=A0A1L9UN40_ASPBC|nr:hypothetical protein ASPBRDRAFT_73571 [Aspergillus brasiliensis CBS 101740]